MTVLEVLAELSRRGGVAAMASWWQRARVDRSTWRWPVARWFATRAEGSRSPLLRTAEGPHTA